MILLMKRMGIMDEYQAVGYETVPVLIFKMSARPEGEDATLYIAVRPAG